MNRATRDLLLVVAVSSFCFFLNLGGPHLWDRDEPRNAGCAAEMLAANDWIVPTFNAQLREHKPALTYWMMMFSYLVFGVTEFSARLPSALYGVGTSVLTYFIGRQLFSSTAGLWGAIALSTTMMFGVASRAATPDAPLIFYSTLAVAIYIWGTTSATHRTGRLTSTSPSRFVTLFPAQWWVASLMYAVMGLAVLAKGPIGMILPTAVIGMFLLLKRLPPQAASPVQQTGIWGRIIYLLRPFAPLHFLKTCWAMRPVTALLCALAVALPWYILVHLKTDGEWTYGFFVKHNVGRALNSMDGHRGNVLFYPVALIVGFFPWSIFWIPTLLDGIQQLKIKSKWNDGYLFAFCWVGVYLALFSIAKTKLPSYITPCYPGLALAIGLFVDRWTSGELQLAKVWTRLAFGSLIAVGCGVLVALPIIAHYFVPEEQLLGLLGLIPVAGGLLALYATEQNRVRRAGIITAFTAVIISPAIFAYAAAEVSQHRHMDAFVKLLYQGQQADEVDVISYSSSEASWVFYARQPIEQYNDPERASVELMRRSPEEKPRVLITTGARLKKMEPFLSQESITMQQMPYFMEGDEIVVIRPRKEIIQTAAETVTETSDLRLQ